MVGPEVSTMSERHSDSTATDGGRPRDDDSRDRGRERRRTSEERQRNDRGRTGDRRRDRGGRRPDDRPGRKRSGERGTAPPGQDRAGGGSGTPPGSPGPGDRQGASGGDDSGGVDLGRREFLLGGAGAAALAAGGWWFFLRGPTGAKAVVADLYGALSSNDWATVDRLIHEDSAIARQIEDREGVDSYEEYLADFGGLERQENTTYTVKGLHEMDHEPNPDSERVPSFEPDAHDVTEFKWILAVVEMDASDWDGLSENEEPRQVRDNTVRVALNGNGDWKLW